MHNTRTPPTKVVAAADSPPSEGSEGARAAPPLATSRSSALVALLAAGAAYWIAGTLALQMAIPPGYATPVWPAAGIALIAVLVWGNGVAPGIALGSFFVNVGTAFDSSSPERMGKAILVALAISVGASCQALLGARLVRTFVGFPVPLEDERSITRFTVLGGPVACLVSPTVGVCTLLVAGLVPWQNCAFSWWTWWVGDAIGVLIFAPLSLILLPGAYDGWRGARAIVAVALLGGFVVVTMLFLQVSAWEEGRVRAHFERRAVHLAQALQATLSGYERTVGFVAGLFYASDEVTRAEFRQFVATTRGKDDGIRALGWGPLVPNEERAEYEERARRDGLAGFAFMETAADGQIQPAAIRPEYVPAYYIEPGPENQRALGLDSSSNPLEREALNRARASGRPSATAPLEVNGTVSVVLYVPVFRPATAEEGSALRGYAGGVFDISEAVTSAFGKLDINGLDFSLVEERPHEAARPLFVRREEQRADAGSSPAGLESETWSELIDFGGRHYRLMVHATSASLNTVRSWQAWLVLAVGLLFIRIMGVVMLMTTGRAARAQRTLEERTRLNLELEERVRARTLELSANLKEREVLLQEVHHRVRNNLQVISSLINMQVRQSTEPKNRDALTDCRTRIEAIALIHEALYQSDDYSEIPFSEYARSLSNNLFHLAAVSPSVVVLELEIADVVLTVDRAIPCGLILNELVINALKHAFPEGRRGTVRIELRHVGSERLTLCVADDGIGMPASLDVGRSGRLGLQLVRTLAGQLDAELLVRREGGTRFELSFLAKGRRECRAPRQLEY